MRKEGRNSLVDQILVGVCHMQTYENKKACSHMNLRAHTRNEARSPEKRAFLDSSHDQCDERLTDAKDIAGLDVHLHVLLPLLPSFLQHFGFEGRVQKRNARVLFFPFSYKLSREKQVKLLKVDFRKM